MSETLDKYPILCNTAGVGEQFSLTTKNRSERLKEGCMIYVDELKKRKAREGEKRNITHPHDAIWHHMMGGERRRNKR